MRLLILFLFPLLAHTQENSRIAHVAHIIDGDTFVTTQGEHIRMLGINTPEKEKGRFPAEPYADEARDALKKLLHKARVSLVFSKKKKDKFKRTLAHVYIPYSKTWANEYMVKNGFAHVYSFPDTVDFRTKHLLKAEDYARQNKKGLWSLPRWETRNAHEVFSDDLIGKFHIVEGTVSHTAEVKGRLYLNFGDDWRTDFTIEMPSKHRHKFGTPADYMQKNLRVRGILKPVNGVMITVTHPEQIEFLN